ncbi:TPA: hypothetical protein ACLA6X_002187, partial [Neisseria meningitidis]
ELISVVLSRMRLFSLAYGALMLTPVLPESSAASVGGVFSTHASEQYTENLNIYLHNKCRLKKLSFSDGIEP